MPASATEFARAAGYERYRELPAESGPSAALLRRIHDGALDEPLILRGFASAWPAVRLWDQAYLLDRCGELRVHPSVGLPAHGVPYLLAAKDLRREMSLKQFWQEMQSAGRCYVDQHPLDHFAPIAADIPIAQLLEGRRHNALNLWLGRGTKSGLHFDNTDNFLTMIRGDKTAVLAAPQEARRLYPFIDATSKSQLDVEAPAFDRYPRASGVELWIGRLDAGDVLYIPHRWWHYLASSMDDYSISVNCWFGRRSSLSTYIRYVMGLGPRYITRVLRDFAVHGVLRRPFFHRNYSAPPEGLLLYGLLRMLFRRLLRLPQRGPQKPPG